MNRNDQRKITRNLVALRKAIQNDVVVVAARLHEEKVFNNEIKVEIESVRPKLPQLQCGMLLNKLLRSGPDAYGKFIKILEELGHKSVIGLMEKSQVKGPCNTLQADDREKTFIISTSKIQKNTRRAVPLSEEADDNNANDTHVTNGNPNENRLSSFESRISEQRDIDSRIDEVHQLERMVTFVLSRLGEKEKNSNTPDWKVDIKEKLKEESKGNEELMGFFKSLRYNSFALTSQSIMQ